MDGGPPRSSVHGDSPGKNTGVGYSIQYWTVKCTKAQPPGKDACPWEGIPAVWPDVNGHANAHSHLWKFVCMELTVLDATSVYCASQHGCRAPEKHCLHSHQPTGPTCYTPSWLFMLPWVPTPLQSLPWAPELSSQSLHESTWYLEDPFGNTSCMSSWHLAVTAIPAVCSCFLPLSPVHPCECPFHSWYLTPVYLRLAGMGQSV